MHGERAPSLSTEDLAVHFAGVRAVDGVSLTLERGEVLGLIGPNGAGKTTFMNAITGFVAPTRGKVRLGSSDVTGLATERLVRSGVVRTFQGTSMFGRLTAGENVEVGALLAAGNRKRARVRAQELCELFDLTHVRNEKAAVIPQGIERRVAIARAVAAEPEFLLLDEPAAGLNDEESRQLVSTIARVQELSGSGIMLVDHDMHVITAACDRVHVLTTGTSLAEGTTVEIMKNPDVIEAYLGSKKVISDA